MPTHDPMKAIHLAGGAPYIPPDMAAGWAGGDAIVKFVQMKKWLRMSWENKAARWGLAMLRRSVANPPTLYMSNELYKLLKS
jgi:hypothetical protein